MDLLIVGEAPSRTGSKPGSSPLSGRAGARLAELMGVSAAEYEDRFERVNLLGEWPGSAGKGSAFPVLPAMVRAFELREGPWTHYLLLGRRVAAAFGLRADCPYLHWYDLSGSPADLVTSKRVAVLPHPSGIVTWWNSAPNRAAARAFMRRLERRSRVAA